MSKRAQSVSRLISLVLLSPSGSALGSFASALQCRHPKVAPICTSSVRRGGCTTSTVLARAAPALHHLSWTRQHIPGRAWCISRRIGCILWQAKAWVDRPVAMEWAEDVIKPFIESERKAGVATADTRYLLFQDNLDSQKQPAYVDFLQSWGVDEG